MCGIFGYYAKTSTLPEKEELINATDKLLSRGPDHLGYWNNMHVFLGMRRLSIIDLHSGNQPLFFQGEDVVLVFNGEIYNYKEVREELLGLGHTFKTSSDTEVILLGYIQWGRDVLARLNGMFAIAIFDHRSGELFVSRDRMGEKPLYIYEDQDKIIFGSELKAILSCKGLDKTLRPEILDYYFTFGYSKPEVSIFKNIRKLNPGSWVLITGNETQESKFWQLNDFTIHEHDEATTEKEVEALLEDSVDKRMVADVPVGAFLSGGIDSSLLVAMMRKHHSDVQTFTIGFNASTDYDETGDARQVAKHLGVKNTCFNLSEAELIEVLEDLAGYYDEPFADAAAFPLYCLSKFTRSSAKVVLSGDGGDELFAGYSRYTKTDKFAKLASLSNLVPGVMSPLFNELSKRSGNKYFAGIGKTDYYDIYQRSFEICRPGEIQELLQQELNGTDVLTEDYRKAGGHYKKQGGNDAVNQLQYMDLCTRLVESFLQKTDRAMMAQSIEGRLPFLDPRLVEYAMKIPGHHKMKGGESKYILKKILSKYLPHEMVYRPKHGFNVPLEEWLVSRFSTYVEEILLDTQCLERGILRPEKIKKMVAEIKAGKATHTRKLWLILNFELWCRNNI